MKNVLIAIIVVAALAVGGWVIYDHNKSNSSSNTTTPAPSSSQPVASTGAISIKSMMFTPSQITVSKGGTVTWTNNDSVVHTVTDDLSNVGGPSSGNIEPGSTYSFTFSKTGSFQYHCNIHSSMRGTIVVK